MANKIQLTAGITCCSNAIDPSRRDEVDTLVQKLDTIGIHAILSNCVFAKEGVFGGTGEERAKALMDFYRNDDVDLILDISGGDIANEVLPYLDFDLIAWRNKAFWGYSDLTTIDNAIYTKAGRSSVLYQARMLTRDFGEERTLEFLRTLELELQEYCEDRDPEVKTLLDFDYEFVQGDMIDGIAVGGNIRCLLKLAGTPYWPDMTDKILVLEAWHGKVPQMVTFLSQLKEIGVFEQIGGIILGTFTEMEEAGCDPDIVTLVKRYAGTELPIIKSSQIGHGSDARAIEIGAHIRRVRNGQ